jgi:hypothetical protein
MAHEPHRFQTDAERPVKLMAADSFFAAAHKESALEPDMQADVTMLENSPDFHRELLPAVVALPHADADRFAARDAM